jgi:hypothetical protein
MNEILFIEKRVKDFYKYCDGSQDGKYLDVPKKKTIQVYDPVKQEFNIYDYDL